VASCPEGVKAALVMVGLGGARPQNLSGRLVSTLVPCGKNSWKDI
jgi:hypothetical protein